MANLPSRQQQIDASSLMRRGARRLAAPLLEAVPRALRAPAQSSETNKDMSVGFDVLRQSFNESR
jgi:hypothetical protein